MINLSKTAENIRELMDEHELTQAQLACKLGTGRSKLSDMLNARTAPAYPTMLALAEYFNCSADFILGLSEYPGEDGQYRPAAPFKNRLRAMLEESGKSQYSLVKQTGISWSVLHGWLKGRTRPSAANLVKLAQFFDCSVDFLLGRV